MQVPGVDAAGGAVPVGTGVPVQVVAGNLAALPLNELLQATVTAAGPRDAVLTVNGQPLTVRLPAGQPLQPGAVLLLRMPPTAGNARNPTVELSAPPQAKAPAAGGPNVLPRATPGATAAAPPTPASSPAPAAGSAPPAVPAAPPRLAVVDVLAPLPDGRVRAQVDGVEQVATPAEPLAPGGRYLLQVERTPAGLRLTPAPDESPALPTQVATALLRAPAPTLPAAIAPLRAELAALAAAPGANPAAPPAVAVREAAAAVEATLRAILPAGSAPDAGQLRRLVEDGGLHFEAKLARLAEAPDAPAAAPATRHSALAPAASKAPPDASSTSAPASDSAPAPERGPGPDLKGDLLRLLQAVNDLGGAARAPAAEAALRGVEAQQAANVLAQAGGTPYFLQVPFPDAGAWRTLSLSLEPERRPDQPEAEPAGRFRVFMHVPLTDLGETWIDAGLAGDKFRATIYLDRTAVRDRVRAALPELRDELRAEGFSEVLLDVRASGELPEGRRREAGAVRAGRPEAVSVLDVRA